MFDTELEVAPVVIRASVLGSVVGNRTARLGAEAEKLVLAAQWADLHAPECLPPAQDSWEERRRRLQDEHPVRIGGAGTPSVLAHAPGELAVVARSTFVAARSLMADALDLRHRLPRIWATLTPIDGPVEAEAWQARRVAQATRHLTAAQATEVDKQLAGFLGHLAWGRLATLLDAAVAAADPAGAAAAELAAAQARFVAVGRVNDHHIVTMVARIDALDGFTLMALVNRVAEILAVDAVAAGGALDPVEVRRAEALGLLARPDQVLALLCRHAPVSSDRTSARAHPADPVDRADPQDPEDSADEQPSSLERAIARPEGACSTPGMGTARVVQHVHLTDLALRDQGDGGHVCRVEGVGPVTARTVRGGLAGSQGRDDHRPPGRQPRALLPGRQLRDPPTGPRRDPLPQPGRRLPLGQRHRAGHGPGPHPPVSIPRTRGATRSDERGQPRPGRPPTPPVQDPGPDAVAPARPRGLPVADHPRLHLPGHQHRHLGSRPYPHR